MTYDAKELEQYPEIMNKEQLRKACHISKRTAHYLLQFNLIPHVCTGKKTRCYAIKKRDVIDFMINREINPSRYIVPTSWYKYGNEDVKLYKIRIQPPLPNDPQKTRRYYESKLAAYLDVIDVAAAAPKQASPVTAQMQKVLDYISEHGHITDEEVQSLLEIKKTRAFELMKQMRNMELINVVGRGSGKHYLIKQ